MFNKYKLELLKMITRILDDNNTIATLLMTLYHCMFDDVTRLSDDDSVESTLPTESVFGVRMLHMLTDSAMSGSGVQIEGITFVRVKILDYHDMLAFILPIHLYEHQNMIYL